MIRQWHEILIDTVIRQRHETLNDTVFRQWHETLIDRFRHTLDIVAMITLSLDVVQSVEGDERRDSTILHGISLC